jgi:hypothetical protein
MVGANIAIALIDPAMGGCRGKIAGIVTLTLTIHLTSASSRMFVPPITFASSVPLLSLDSISSRETPHENGEKIYDQ